MNNFKFGSDGRTAYERITENKCRHDITSFAEVVDYILETDKTKRFKADSRVGKGIFLGYTWRFTEYVVGTKDCVCKYHTIRRRAEELAYDPDCMDYLKVTYSDFFFRGALP